MSEQETERTTQKPEHCETEGCYREPDRLLGIGLAESYLDMDANEERWSCEQCHQAIQFGNGIPGGNVEVRKFV